MEISFSKYQGTGNDFILLDNRDGKYNELDINVIQFICDRRFGIGADGLIKINSDKIFAFEMDYYNADGTKSFCGNGARCSLAFFEKLGNTINDIHFIAIDGIHQANKQNDLFSLKMNDVQHIDFEGKDFIINTGSPHYIKYVDNALAIDVFNEGKKIRYSPKFNEDGINVNFVEKLKENTIEVRTYERGVEDETLSCGTGVTAAALIYGFNEHKIGEHAITIHTKGGHLQVYFKQEALGVFKEVYLVGPAQHVFDGKIIV